MKRAAVERSLSGPKEQPLFFFLFCSGRPTSAARIWRRTLAAARRLDASAASIRCYY